MLPANCTEQAFSSGSAIAFLSSSSHTRKGWRPQKNASTGGTCAHMVALALVGMATYDGDTPLH